MNYHALNSEPLEFLMVGWPYYVTNTTRELAFYYYYFLTRENDLLLPKATGYPAVIWQLNREIRASKLGSKELTWNAATGKCTLAHSAPYKHSVAGYSKEDTNTSSHCAMIHVSPWPLNDGTTNYSAIACDVVVRGTFELDFTCPKDV